MGYHFGIDFGTTNSAVVGIALDGNRRRLIKCGDADDRPIPSTVAIDLNGKVFVGRDAWKNKMRLRETCTYFHSIKTILDADKIFLIAGRERTPVDIAAEVFRHLKSIVRDKLNVEMREAFVAIPIGFGAQKRSKLRRAAASAGIEIKSFVSEPTAAFAANYAELKSASTVAIFDWGGGTLDVSIIRHAEGNIFELATSGLPLAGDHIDQKIAEKVHDRIARRKKLNLAFADMSSSDRDMIINRAEKLKLNFSFDDVAELVINRYGEYGACRERFDYNWFELLIEPEIARALALLDETIARSGAGVGGIDRIVMVGGSSNLRPLIERMEKKYGAEKLFFPNETMWNVGEGAALLSTDAGAYHSNQSLGLILSDGTYYELLARGEELDGWSRRCNFGVVDTSNQARFVFASREGLDDEKLVREGLIAVENYRFLQEQLIAEAKVDADLIFRVTAQSDMRPRSERVWEYANLKCYYRLPNARRAR